jgi:hypothetical protein
MSNATQLVPASDAQPLFVYDLHLEEDGAPNRDRAVSIAVQVISGVGADIVVDRYSIRDSLHLTYPIFLE